MLKLISFKICPFVARIAGLLKAKGLDYQVEYIDLKAKPDWFLQISPTGQVPVLVAEGGQALFESDAIAEYLDEIAAPLHPDLTPEQRALDRAWVTQASKHYLVQCSTMQSKDRATIVERAQKLHASAARAEAALSERVGPFWHGGQPGNVDLAWAVLFHRADLVRRHSGYDFYADFPRVKAWQQAVLATGLAEASVAPEFNERFHAFYLSDRSWLGRGADLDEAPGRCAPQAAGCCG